MDRSEKVGQNGSGGEETAYKFVGAAANGLVVVIATYNGGGSGYFTTLHILDVVAARAFDDEGKLAWQVDLTLLRSVVLGDRWDGEVGIANNTICTYSTARSGPTNESGAPPPMTSSTEPALIPDFLERTLPAYARVKRAVERYEAVRRRIVERRSDRSSSLDRNRHAEVRSRCARRSKSPGVCR